MLLPLGAMGRSSWHPMLPIFILGLLSSTSVATIPVTGTTRGVNTQTGERPSRLDIQTFQNSGAPFDLYIQCLQKFQSVDQTDLQSYYQISGIHGLPYTAWDGVQGAPGQETGYCEHSSTLFPTWHRPFLALYEQTLTSYAQDIANSYPQSSRSTYQAAANQLRIPYWDWASNASLPNCLVTPQITINTPSGQQQVTNPLYTYSFNPPQAGKDFPSSPQVYQYNQTVRSPDSHGNSQNSVVQGLMQANGAWIQSSTYQLLSAQTNYSVFSTDSLPDRGPNYNNLEMIHDTIHGLVGNGGHMTYLTVAAFDPLFWLHHCNIDRILSLWEVINPNSWVEPEPNAFGTFVIQPRTVETVNTPLYPFHASSNSSDFWTSATVRSLKVFGYRYPEIQDWGVSQQTLINNVKVAVNKLYNPTGGSSKRSIQPTERRQANSSKVLNGKLNHEEFVRLRVNNLNKYWVVNIAVDRTGVVTPFMISFYYGPAPNGTSQQGIDEPNFIGSIPVIPMPLKDSTGTSYNQLPLSPVLANGLNSNAINSLDESEIVPLLTEKLSWVVVDTNGNVLDIQEVIDKGGLTITVAARDVQPLQNGQENTFPEYSDWQEYDEPTQGKPGGVRNCGCY